MTDNYIRMLKQKLEKHNSVEFSNKCLEYAKNLIANNLPVLFDEKHVNLTLKLEHSFTSENMINSSYHAFNISNNYKTRLISAPSKNLKIRQRWILDNILINIPISDFAYGFKTGCSIKNNAMIHANHTYAICLDIKDFFPSIKFDSVVSIFSKCGYSSSASKRLAQLCCYNRELPQGAPTSPQISNIICKDLDIQLNSIALKYDAAYSRYADDITFSANDDINDALPIIKKTIQSFGFQINNSKTTIYSKGQPKFITGLVVQNGTVRIPKKLKRELKKEIYYCQKFGVTNHLINSGAKKFINYREHLYGKAYYIFMVEPEVGAWFLEQLDRIAWPEWCL